MLETDYRPFPAGDEPDCQVDVDGTWRDGYVRAWSLRPEETPPGWYDYVMWSDGPGEGNHPEWFHQDRVRQAVPGE